MENFSSFERVVGKISQEEKENILREKSERFNDQFFEVLEGKEREKTEEELAIFSLTNEATNELRQTYGLTDFDVPSKNIHVIKKEKWPKEEGAAFYNSMMQAIAIKEEHAKIVFLKNILHEMIHLKSYGSMQITANEDPQEHEYRSGITITKRDGSRLFFRNINEAVVEELTMKLFSKLYDHPIFSKEVKQTSEIAEKGKDALSSEGEKLFTKDTYYAEIEDIGNNKGRISVNSFVYSKERRILKKLIHKIFDRNSNDFENEQQIFELFASSIITGNILTLGKLIDSTFPKGTFRKIGELDSNIEKQEAFIDGL